MCLRDRKWARVSWAEGQACLDSIIALRPNDRAWAPCSRLGSMIVPGLCLNIRGFNLILTLLSCLDSLIAFGLYSRARPMTSNFSSIIVFELYDCVWALWSQLDFFIELGLLDRAWALWSHLNSMIVLKPGDCAKVLYSCLGFIKLFDRVGLFNRNKFFNCT